MSTSYVSLDGHWTVSAISIDGKQRLRVEYDQLTMPDGHVVPVQWDRDGRRCGITRTAHGFLVADVASVGDVARYVDLKDLTQANP